MIHEYEGFIIKEVDDKFHLYYGERLVSSSCASLEDAKELADMEATWLDYQLSKINS
jgi:hypothetical protein